jgi:hypothetical protein
MRAKALGHGVRKVRDLNRSVPLYAQVLGSNRWRAWAIGWSSSRSREIIMSDVGTDGL